MSFYIREPKLDIGETPLENMFINNFMSLADEVQLKVYLAGLYLARSKSSSSNIDISKLLNLDLKDIEGAWSFWESLGLVKREMGSVSFLSVRELYLDSNYVTKSSGLKDREDYIILKQEHIVLMFQRAEEVMNSVLSPESRIKYLRLMEEYNLSAEMLLKAIELTYERAEKPTRSYTEAILKKWRERGINSLEKVEFDNEDYKRRLGIYKEVNERLMGKSAQPSKSQVLIIDKYLDSPGGEELALEAANYVSLHYKSVTYAKYGDLYKKLEEEGDISLQGLEKQGKKYVKTEGPKRKERQNFSQDTYKKMSRDEGIKAMQRRNPALNIARRKPDDK